MSVIMIASVSAEGRYRTSVHSSADLLSRLRRVLSIRHPAAVVRLSP